MASFSSFKSTAIATSNETAGVSTGVTVYASRDTLPTVGNSEGDQAYVTGNNRLYIWNGSGWYNVALLNVAPAISSVQDSDGGTTPFTLSIEGAVTRITITAADSDGDPITYSATADSDFAGLATISDSDNVFTITPFSQDSASTTSGTITFKATDGVNVASSGVQTFTLNFLSWDPSDFTKSSHPSQSLYVNTSPYNISRDCGVFVSSNGSHVAVYGRNSSTTQNYSWSLATNWDLGTASDLGNSTLHITGTNYGGAPWFSDDGLTYWVLDADGQGKVYMFTLTTPYNLTTANTSSYSTYTMSGTGGKYAYNIGFSSDGLKFWSYASYDKKYHVYTLTTAYDLSTATQTSNGVQLPSLTAIGSTVQWAASFDITGTKLAVLHLNPSDAGDEQWSNYDVPTAFDPTSITDSNLIGTTSLNLNGSYTSIGMSLPDGENMYLFDRSLGYIIWYYI